MHYEPATGRADGGWRASDPVCAAALTSSSHPCRTMVNEVNAGEAAVPEVANVAAASKPTAAPSPTPLVTA